MSIVVMGLLMLTGAVVREQGQGFDDFGWRRGVEQATASESSNGGAAVTVIAGPPVGTVSMSGGDQADAAMSPLACSVGIGSTAICMIPGISTAR